MLMVRWSSWKPIFWPIFVSPRLTSLTCSSVLLPVVERDNFLFKMSVPEYCHGRSQQDKQDDQCDKPKRAVINKT